MSIEFLLKASNKTESYLGPLRKNAQDKWVKVEPEENVFVVNIGDMMSFFSNGIIKGYCIAKIARFNFSPSKTRLYDWVIVCQNIMSQI